MIKVSHSLPVQYSRQCISKLNPSTPRRGCFGLPALFHVGMRGWFGIGESGFAIPIDIPLDEALWVLIKYEFLKNIGFCSGIGAGISGISTEGEADPLDTRGVVEGEIELLGTDGAADPEDEGEIDSDPDTTIDGDTLADGDSEADGDSLALGLTEADGEGLKLADGEIDADSELADGESDELGETDTETEALGEIDADGEVEAELDALPERDADAEALGDWEAEALADGD